MRYRRRFGKLWKKNRHSWHRVALILPQNVPYYKTTTTTVVKTLTRAGRREIRRFMHRSMNIGLALDTLPLPSRCACCHRHRRRRCSFFRQIIILNGAFVAGILVEKPKYSANVLFNKLRDLACVLSNDLFRIFYTRVVAFFFRHSLCRKYRLV